MGASVTKQYNYLASFLETDVLITKLDRVTHYSCSALWDTGATNSMISESVVQALGLDLKGMVEIEGFQGIEMRPYYEVMIVLDNGIVFNPIKVVGAATLATHEALLGMDIISQMDFAITNVGGLTLHSVRFPSEERINFSSEQ